MKTLYKTTVTFWTDFDPKDIDLETLGYEADVGDAISTDYNTSVFEAPFSREIPDAVQDFLFGSIEG